MNGRRPKAEVAVSDYDSIVASVTGRERSLFERDVESHESVIRDRIEGKRILVTGAAGSIGSATVKQIARRQPALLVAVDLSENSMVELVRDIRSQSDLDVGDALRTYIIDFGSGITGDFIDHVGPFDLVLHFAALKHVRSERDVFSLSRMIETNVLSVDRFLSALKKSGSREVFAVSSDKACRPASLMGASKRMMEQVLFWHAEHGGSLLGSGDGEALRWGASTRFANVAFSDGSLLAGFLLRIRKRQPLAGPSDVGRYFISDEEASQLCLLTVASAQSRQLFVPRLDASADVKRFDQIAEVVLESCGYRPHWYESEEEARNGVNRDLAEGRFPCCFTPSRTSGEKPLEEFVADEERLAASPFQAIDVIGETPTPDSDSMAEVLAGLAEVVKAPDPSAGKRAVVELVSRAVPAFHHIETGRSLDEKM